MGPATRRLTMADVATLAGVSKATVSRVLNGEPGVSAETRMRIKALVDELSYVVSPDAARLSRGRTGRVAVVMPQTTTWFYAAVLAGVLSVLRPEGFDALVYQVADDTESRRFFADLPAKRQVDAAIVVAFPVSDYERRQLDLLGVPVVIAGGALPDHPHVRVDDVAAARQAVTHLTLAGHERIAMINSAVPPDRPYAPPVDRLRGYRTALDDAGLRYDAGLVVELPWSATMGAEGMDRLLSADRPPTAVFAFSDEVAIGALRSLRRAGIAVPRQLSLVGIDDHPLAELSDLTTVRQPVELQGVHAARMALALLGGGSVADAHVTIPTHLVIRGTTAAP
ncbi:LacI family DNA-binding transcriptional regulator [Asanoa sp. WMMD1127]|uniref:LacI family DNA-binding transcriptional regulator n=1 Tax=Asanoa sp. WMMD1127 TaxID=3016107 RepID=UPI002415B361|nr:LacI family DNA-binding transcriptional regulator [Asanoa sp. WMMD1127]MDG4823261.1 LacI family DNA-binding transcriptional regulator [Asanoa sp. WMMD1127]